MITDEEIDRAIRVLDTVRKDAIENSEYGFQYDWKKFMKRMRILTPQSSGSRIQNYIFKKLGWTKISALLNKGDVKNTLGQFFEVKVSTITTSNPGANVVQIRLWQNVSGYHVFVIDSTTNYNLTHFALSKSEMRDEVELCGNSAHGTKEATKNNVNIEYAIRFLWSINDKTYNRWVRKYKQDTDLGN